MSQQPQKSFVDLLGKRVLILGDIRSGKTRLTASLLREAITLGFSTEITVIDMAPKSSLVKGLRVGGRLFEASNRPRGIRYLAPRRVETPRLSSRSAEELLRLVEENRRRIHPLLGKYLSRPTPILFVNDISIYLQSGDFKTLYNVMQAASTFVANGYCGTTLEEDFNTGISTTEHKLVEELAASVDIQIRLSPERLGIAAFEERTLAHARFGTTNMVKATLAEALFACLGKQSAGAARDTYNRPA